METLDIKQALALVDGEKSLLYSLLDSFVNAKNFNPVELQKLLDQEKYQEAASYVHFFKGAARQIYAEKCAFSGQSLEDCIKQHDKKNISGLIKNFEQDLKEAVSEAKKQMQTLR